MEEEKEEALLTDHLMTPESTLEPFEATLDHVCQVADKFEMLVHVFQVWTRRWRVSVWVSGQHTVNTRVACAFLSFFLSLGSIMTPTPA